MKKLLTFCLLLLCSGSVIAESKFAPSTAMPVEEKTYLCITEAVGGLFYDENIKEWRGGNFKPKGKYLVKLNDVLNDKCCDTGSVKEFGVDLGYDCSENAMSGDVLQCRNWNGGFLFNKKTLRFLESYMRGYYDGIDAISKTPMIKGGTCSPL